MLLVFTYLAAGFVEVAENDRLRRTCLLASGRDFAIADAAVFLFRGDAGRGDALDAIRAFLHHAAPAHGDFGIVHRLEAGRVIIGVAQEIEPPNLVRTIVRAESRADAAI